MNQAFTKALVTPTTKEKSDRPISPAQIVSESWATAQQYDLMQQTALQLFERGTQILQKKGLILVDTKYEFGMLDGQVVLMDEIHTPDSSRYFYADGYVERQQKGERQRQLSKEFVREWLIANNFMGKEGQTVPEMTDEWVDTISKRYIELYEKVIGTPFSPQSFNENETFQKILASLEKLH